MLKNIDINHGTINMNWSVFRMEELGKY